MARPIKKFYCGGITAAVFENSGRLSVLFQKSYKNKNGTYENTNYFNPTDLGNLIAVAHQAMNFYFLLEDAAKKNANKGRSEPPVLDDFETPDEDEGGKFPW